MTDAVQSFLDAWLEHALFCAERGLIARSDDARFWDMKPVTNKDVITRFNALRGQWNEMGDRMSSDEADEWKWVSNICQGIGHIRLVDDIGKPRFVCTTCIFVFDADLRSPSLLIRGMRGTERMPGVWLDPNLLSKDQQKERNHWRKDRDSNSEGG